MAGGGIGRLVIGAEPNVVSAVIAPPIHQDVVALCIRGEHGAAVTEDGVLLRRFGQRWLAQAAPESLSEVQLLEDGALWAAGARSHWRLDGTTWTASTPAIAAVCTCRMGAQSCWEEAGSMERGRPGLPGT